MALNATALSALIKSNLLADTETSKAVDNDALTALCDAIAQAVVTHIVAAGLVNVTVVTACPAGAGSGTGTGTIT